jgi:hypothetical protein
MVIIPSKPMLTQLEAECTIGLLTTRLGIRDTQDESGFAFPEVVLIQPPKNAAFFICEPIHCWPE